MENKTLLNNQLVQEEIKREKKTKTKNHENGNKIFQNLWDATKEVLRRKFIVINAYIKKLEDLKQPNFTTQRTRKRTNSALS